jgi:hypothetical protein
MNKWVQSICQVCGFIQDMENTGKQTPEGWDWESSSGQALLLGRGIKG